MAIRAVSLDLFDTVVDLHMERLPRMTGPESGASGTTGELHAAWNARAPVAFEVFHAALREVDQAHRRIRYQEGREIGTLVRFTEVAERLGARDPELPGLLTEVHMGRLRSVAETPAHHAGTLDALRRGLRVGICSNFTHAPTARRILEEEGLAAHLDAVVISEDVGVRKPRPEIFDAVVAELGCDAEETLHVGDNLDADVAGAAARGLPTAWLTRRVKDPEAVLRAHDGRRPDHVVADLGELLAIVRAG